MEEYDEVHINVSGGIDSVATTLVAVYGYQIPKEKIKLVHMRALTVIRTIRVNVNCSTGRRPTNTLNTLLRY